MYVDRSYNYLLVAVVHYGMVKLNWTLGESACKHVKLEVDRLR